VENPACGEYDKQDCERKAFQRLAVRLKQAFPRLPILILADGLYPYEGFFAACRAQGWAFCTTFKEGSLKSLWEEVHGLQPLQSGQHRTEVRYLPGGKKLTQHYQWVTQLEYQNHPLYWLACEETITWTESQTDGTEVSKTQQVRFVHITSLPVHRDNVVSLSATGRLRWKVENEGFNTLKNGGYAMEHKWSRNSYRALKNYFQFMQMAHLIHQLMLKRDTFVQTWLKGDNHPTVKSLWDDLLGAMQWSKVKLKKLRKILQTPIQFRLLS
jgi:hypothetical protein